MIKKRNANNVISFGARICSQTVVLTIKSYCYNQKSNINDINKYCRSKILYFTEFVKKKLIPLTPPPVT